MNENKHSDDCPINKISAGEGHTFLPGFEKYSPTSNFTTPNTEDHPKIIKPEPYQSPPCACCGRNEDLRMGWCFDCAGLQSLLVNKTDMWDHKYSDWSNTEILSHIVRTVKRNF